jgi:hypothetical protein
VRWADGWTAGGGGPAMAAEVFERVRMAWREGGREGDPELRALGYFALGPAAEMGRSYLVDYYGQLGEMFWPSVPKDREGLAEAVRQFEATGAGELVFSPTIASIEQVDLLAEAVL